MAMIFINCPHCQTQVSSRTDSDKFEYGSPIRTCYSCGMPYFDDFYKEIELEGIKPSMLWVLGPWAILSLCFFFFFLVLYSIDSFDGYLFALIVLLVAPIIDLVTYRARKKELLNEAELSRLRLTDKAYAEALRKFGCYVPNHYLEE